MKARPAAAIVFPIVLVLLIGALERPPTVQMVLEEGTNFALALSPDGSRLIMDLQGRLWSLPAGGGEARALTDGLGDDRLPDWSPEDDRIVFQSVRAGSWDLWTIHPDGTGLEPLTQGAFDDREPVWSPDGKGVAFSSDRSGNYDLWVLDVDSREVRQLTRHPANDAMPTWSPDGSAIAFISDRGEGGEAELWKIRLEDGSVEKVASLPGGAASPSWSPDGRRIALRLLSYRPLTLMDSRFDEGLASDLITVPSEGGEVLRLTEGEDVFPFRPSWTRTGDILYTSDGKIRRLSVAGAGSAGERRAETVPFQATVELRRPAYRRRRSRLPEPGENLPVRGIVRPVLSPDGSLVAFSALGDIWVVSVEGGEPIPLTRDEYLDSDPSWSPDGKHLVFASDRSGTMDLWVKDIESSPKSGDRRLTGAPGAEVAPSWSPDGRFIAFLDEESNLKLVDAGGGAARLLHRARRGAGLPSWSGDSLHIALAVHEPYSTRFREGANRILIVSIGSGRPRDAQGAPKSDAEEILGFPERSFGSRDGDGPVWSPDGRKMAFAMDGGLFVLPVTPDGMPTGPLREVVGEPADFPSWTPDSEGLLYLASDRLVQVDVETGSRRQVSLDLSYRVPSSGGKIVVQGVRLIDGTGGPPQDNVDVVIEGNRIQSVEPGGSVSQEDARVVEASGKTLIPGLIEMHTHLSLPAWGSRHGRVWLAYGITSIRTPAAPIYRTLEEREAIVAGRRVGPRIFYTGYTFDGDRIYYAGSLAIDAEGELGRELERAFRLEYDLVKTYVRLPDTLQKKIVEEAHRKGLFVTSHEIYPAVAYGVDGIEHVKGTSRRGFSPKMTELGRSYQDVVRLVSGSGAYFTPTLLIYGGYALARAREPELLDDPRLDALFPPWVLEAMRQQGAPADVREREAVMRPLFSTVARISGAGGRLVAGTDSPIVPYGLSLILEIEQMSEAGLGPLEAIRSATQVAAQALGAGKELGTIEVGKLADMVILGADPLEDIRNLRRAEQIILNGRLASVEQLLGKEAPPHQDLLPERSRSPF
ncbi:MAG: amidohydrolase family protein [Acidobacteriota bacterium]